MRSMWELTPLNAGVPINVQKSSTHLDVSDIGQYATSFSVTTVQLTINPHISFPSHKRNTRKPHKS